jgi:hypothetical protein
MTRPFARPGRRRGVLHQSASQPSLVLWMLELTVHPGGTAGGRFIGLAAFMWMRCDRVLVGALRDYVHPGDPVATSTTQLHPREVFGHPDADFAIATRVHGVSWHRFDAADGSGEFTVWLLDITGQSRSCAGTMRAPPRSPASDPSWRTQ